MMNTRLVLKMNTSPPQDLMTQPLGRQWTKKVAGINSKYPQNQSTYN